MSSWVILDRLQPRIIIILGRYRLHISTVSKHPLVIYKQGLFWITKEGYCFVPKYHPLDYFIYETLFMKNYERSVYFIHETSFSWMKFHMSNNLYIFQANLFVCSSMTASPAQTIGPITLLFDTIVGHDNNLLIFYSSRSKVKVKKDIF